MRYRLRTQLILLAILPPPLAWLVQAPPELLLLLVIFSPVVTVFLIMAVGFLSGELSK
jgi:hypothetical protein